MNPVLILECVRNYALSLFFPWWVLILAVMAGLLVYFSLGNQKHHLSVDGSVVKADHWLLFCHISSFSAVALISVSLMPQEVLTALFFSCSLFSKGESNVQSMSVLWNVLFYYLSKYSLVLSIALVGTEIRSLLL